MGPKLFHLALRLEGERCLVVGGGTVGARKAKSLLDCGALVTVVAPEVCDELESLGGDGAGALGAGAGGGAEAGGLGAGGARAGLAGGGDGAGARGAGAGGGVERIERRPYRAGEAAAYHLVITATGRPDVDRAVYLDCRQAGIPVNAADDPESCSFLMPAVLREGPVSVAVSTGGTSPWLAGWVRRRIGTVIGPDVGLLTEIVGLARLEVRRTGLSSEGLDWGNLVDETLWPLISAGEPDLARAAADRWVSSVVEGAGAGASGRARGGSTYE